MIALVELEQCLPTRYSVLLFIMRDMIVLVLGGTFEHTNGPCSRRSMVNTSHFSLLEGVR